MTRRGGARVRVFGAKPSPFFGILRAVRGVGRGFGKKRRMVAVCAVGLGRKKFKFREHKICEKRFENLVTKSTLFNTTFLRVPKIGHLRKVEKSSLRLGMTNFAKFKRKTAIWFKVRAVFARAN